MCIPNERHYLFLNIFFNGQISSAACRPVSINDFLFSERGFKKLLLADDTLSELREKIFQSTLWSHQPGSVIVYGIYWGLNVHNFFIVISWRRNILHLRPC